MPDGLNDLPRYVCYAVAARLPLGDVAALRAVDRHWRDVIENAACWSIRCTVRYAAALEPYVAGWPGGEWALHGRVAAVLTRHAQRCPPLAARIVRLRRMFVDVGDACSTEPSLMVMDSHQSTTTVTAGAVLAAQWDVTEQQRVVRICTGEDAPNAAIETTIVVRPLLVRTDNAATETPPGMVVVDLLLLLPERICREVPQFSCPGAATPSVQQQQQDTPEASVSLRVQPRSYCVTKSDRTLGLLLEVTRTTWSVTAEHKFQDARAQIA